MLTESSTSGEDSCHRTSTSDILTMDSSEPSSLMTTVISLDENEVTTAQRSRSAFDSEGVEPFKRDPCRGPIRLVRLGQMQEEIV
ncbi:unnamed protein product [Didymodactylos carnosus]|uniref:Uncharacterized protein n=1 Tax=Didymodactylos carnosus TaxID=1234261 RepID=A0A8S2SSA8_9BILA|nr:unnamed protein product [Didymodactylos carnosus]CAF4244190.1 unnamed protein product [Didymodactylos carnosus]